MVEAFYSHRLEKFELKYPVEILALIISVVVFSIGLFILTNKNLSKHPYPMIACAIISSGAYIFNFSNFYWTLNAFIFRYFPYENESWIISLFESSWKSLLMILGKNSKLFELDWNYDFPKKKTYFVLKVLIESFRI